MCRSHRLTGDSCSPPGNRRRGGPRQPSHVAPTRQGGRGGSGEGVEDADDLGRTARLFSGAQRRGLNLTQPTCTATGCDWPAHLCHAHHDEPWQHGGTTDLANGRNLCPRHHARIHDPSFECTRHPDGRVSFHRRP